jgi:hypothetical protein
MIPSNTNSTTWIERYETLRRHVLNGGPLLELQPLSLVLWLAQGMAGWMRRWTKAAEVVPSSAVVPRPLPYPTTSLLQQQLTLLLAQITVQRLYPASSL